MSLLHIGARLVGKQVILDVLTTLLDVPGISVYAPFPISGAKIAGPLQRAPHRLLHILFCRVSLWHLLLTHVPSVQRQSKELCLQNQCCVFECMLQVPILSYNPHLAHTHTHTHTHTHAHMRAQEVDKAFFLEHFQDLQLVASYRDIRGEMLHYGALGAASLSRVEREMLLKVGGPAFAAP
eukprot:1036056-Pelagomonas_calceolata.AAC.1